MSLINKMLQDLDARAGQPGATPLPADVRLPPAPEPRTRWMRGALAGGAVVALATAGVIGWRMAGEQPPPVAVAAAAPVAPAAPAPKSVLVEMPAAAPVQVADVAPPAPVAPEPVPEPEPAPPPPKPASAPRKPAPPKPAPVAQGRVETAPQRAENTYRRALLVLEDGRVTEAIATLQAGLRIDPKHEPSRQTLVGLLIEAGRTDEAMRQLQAALALDARQPSMAMLLARLQLEKGGPAIDTLMRTLPYAAGNGEYHAFLAGVLQREGRHREAAEHYQAALRTTPGNGVWWMGLGISLQAEKRDAEAMAAFRRAQGSATLSAELAAFVERRLGQLER
ncbi:tetratricopeptide repeat protein [Massilia sp. CFBP9026]|uniref:tetratricopeptide repeat protein n=1 Tax=Massilia sp. CFBP9026 TaxID=3096536 RepID=UPI002A6A6414|nr:tetratricopeptide repeat protein [Massilia sp. CFBP9026]MDY0964116.1 tetratricopeptide repeat protein [Massilia sp. CFBP9026]